MTQKEKEFCDFMFEEVEHKADKSVYYKIIHSKNELLEEIETKFPEECAIFHRYSYEPNYWNVLKEEYETLHLLNE